MSSKVIVTIFGASGDLAKRKLYPSLFRLYKSGNLSEHFAVIGTARRPWSKEYFESVVVESILDLADSTEPVTYTHLDVYMRQGQASFLVHQK